MRRSDRSGRVGRRQWRADEAREFLGRWRESGQSLAGYCREQRIGYERVRRWRQKLDPKGNAGGELKLRELRVVPAERLRIAERTAEIELEFPSRHVIRVRGPVEIERIVRLVDGLAGRTC